MQARVMTARSIRRIACTAVAGLAAWLAAGSGRAEFAIARDGAAVAVIVSGSHTEQAELLRDRDACLRGQHAFRALGDFDRGDFAGECDVGAVVHTSAPSACISAMSGSEKSTSTSRDFCAISSASRSRAIA